MTMSDPTENVRRALTGAINANPTPREKLETVYGKDNVWDTQELQRDFSVQGFAAPFCIVTRKSDGKRGSVMFQHNPRFYFDFNEG